MDIATNALREYQKAVKKQHMEKSIHLINGDLTKTLPFKDGFFDVAVDITTLFRLTVKKEIYNYAAEIRRVLKAGGYLLEYQLHPRDKYYSSLPANADGVFVDRDGASGHLYTTNQLRNLFLFGFKPVYAKTLVFRDKSRDIMYGKPYKRTLSLVIFRKR
jgi:ubiquinone/menaquinone biosynthesis C-methylase UbiE